MGVVGKIKDAAGEAAGMLAELRGEISKLSPQAQRTFAEAEARLAQMGPLLATVTDIAEDVRETELVRDLDAAIESVPAEFKALAQAARGLIDHFVRVGTRASNTAQEGQAFIAEARQFLADLRAGKIEFATETKIRKA